MQGPQPSKGSWRAALARASVDLRPLRASAPFRALFASRGLAQLGSLAAETALLIQAKQLTESPLVVGFLGAVEVAPLVVFGLAGGHLADRLDRRRLALACEVALAAVAVLLTVNALLPQPQIAVVFVAAGLTMALSSLQRPSLDAAVPRLVVPQQLAAAAALNSLFSNAGQIVGPALGGLVAAGPGPAVVYGVDALTFAASVGLLLNLPSLRPRPGDPTVDVEIGGLRGLLEGFRYAAMHQELLGSYLVDLAAMILAYAVPLYPFFAGLLQANWATGLLFSAEAVGGLLVSVTSGWLGRIRRYGLGIAIAAAVWSAAIAALGLAPDIVVALLLLVVAGAGDMVSGVLRDALWNRVIPDRVRGRMAGIALLSYGLGPSIGQVRGGVFAGRLGVSRAITAGGVSALLAVGALTLALPRYRRFRVPDA
ncbi:MAG: MFS transporter [Candidatus Dormibacteraeota bacterium]|nr:MFS transporter [Candidatus Dormibacteraeota bacterium]